MDSNLSDPKSFLFDRYLMNASSLVQKIWNFRHTLRDDGVGYGDYLEQLTWRYHHLSPRCSDDDNRRIS